MKKRFIIFFFPLHVAILSMLLLFLALRYNWFGAAAAISLNYCESLHDGIIKQPANTWSNLGFLFTGLYTGWLASAQKYIKFNNRLTRTLFFPTFLSSLIVLLCPGSMAMHASTAVVGGYFDMLSMYLVAAFMFSYAFIRFFRLDAIVFFIAFVMVLIFCHIVHFHNGPVFGLVDVNAIFGFFIGSAAVLEFMLIYIRRISIQKKWAFAFSACFLLAFGIWSVSQTGAMYCDPDSWVQGHAIWHVLDALTLLLLFRYYVSENDPRSDFVKEFN